MNHSTTTRFFVATFLIFLVFACQNTTEQVAETTTEITDKAIELVDENDTDFASKPIAIGLMVADMDAAVAFYKDILGLPEIPGFSLDGAFGVQSGLTDNQPLTIRQFTFGKGPTAATLKLASSPPVEAHQNSGFIHDDNSVQYITVYVKDITPFVERLRAAKIPFQGQTPIRIANDTKDFVLVQDPDGTFVELISE